jgi:hypothetical protein
VVVSFPSVVYLNSRTRSSPSAFISCLMIRLGSSCSMTEELAGIPMPDALDPLPLQPDLPQSPSKTRPRLHPVAPVATFAAHASWITSVLVEGPSPREIWLCFLRKPKGVQSTTRTRGSTSIVDLHIASPDLIQTH